jgi:hypothetical protein
MAWLSAERAQELGGCNFVQPGASRLQLDAESFKLREQLMALPANLLC